MLGVDVEEARRLQRELVATMPTVWFVENTEYIESFAPFYNVPTPAAVSVEGEQRWFAQCGLEALAVRWLFPGKEVRVEASCFDCGDPIVFVARDDEILEIDPESAVGFMNGPFNSELRAGVSGSYF